MAKRRTSSTRKPRKAGMAERPETMEAPRPVAPLPGARRVDTEVEYAFPTKARCPKCNGTDTRATSTRGRYQYRQCGSPWCRKNFRVKGSAI